MKTGGLLNGQIDSALNRQGHMDQMMVVDAGFPVPDSVEKIDIALSVGIPRIMDVLKEILEVHVVEKIILAQETADHNPSYVEGLRELLGDGVEVEIISHTELKKLSHGVKTIVRTGDFTAWGNILLVSGACDRWQLEVPVTE